MEQEPKGRQRSRENVLAVALVALVTGMMLFFLFLVSFGIVGNVLIGASLIVLAGLFHYLVWGRAFAEEVAAERVALQRQEARAAKAPKAKAPPGAIQDISRTQGIRSEPDA